MIKYELREMPIKQNDGKSIIYPKPLPAGTMDLEQLVTHCADNLGIAKAAIPIAVSALEDAMVRCMSFGYAVKIDGLGTFTLSIGFDDSKNNELEDGMKKMTYRRVRMKNLNFKADPKLLQRLDNETEFERDAPEIKLANMRDEMFETRYKRALAYIEKHDFITLQDYMRINDMKKSAASRELNRISDDPTLKITAVGKSISRCWIKRPDKTGPWNNQSNK